MSLKLLADSARTPSRHTGRLREAAERGDLRGVQAELGKGANVNDAGKTRWTALHRAAERGRTDIVQALLAAGADHTLPTSFGGDTALHLAADRGHTGTVQLLVDNGADAKVKNKSSYTPLHSALHGNRQQVARDLLKAGADPADMESTEALPARSLSYYSPRTEYSYSPRSTLSRTASGAAALASPSRSLSGAHTAATLAGSPRPPPAATASSASGGGAGGLSLEAYANPYSSPLPRATSSTTSSSFHEVMSGAALDDKYRAELLSPMRADQERRRREEEHRVRMQDRERRRREDELERNRKEVERSRRRDERRRQLSLSLGMPGSGLYSSGGLSSSSNPNDAAARLKSAKEIHLDALKTPVSPLFSPRGGGGGDEAGGGWVPPTSEEKEARLRTISASRTGSVGNSAAAAGDSITSAGMQLAARKVAEARLEAADTAAAALEAAGGGGAGEPAAAATISSDFNFFKLGDSSGAPGLPPPTSSQPTFGAPPPTPAVGKAPAPPATPLTDS
eukprot:SAG22_NODE_2912_length_2109_cov_3.539801_1_plen_510_part_01